MLDYDIHPNCLCGCDDAKNPGSLFALGHDARAKSTLDRARDNRLAAVRRDWDDNCVRALRKAAQIDPKLAIAGYNAQHILKLLPEEPQESQVRESTTITLRTYRGKINEDGTIRLWEQIDLPTGREVLVTVLEKHQLLPLMGPDGEIRYDEERQRIEEAEDEYWAQVLKDLPSL